ncbi:MAG: hypothetical protein AAGJ87_03185 [Pseudomonadota bacterium]
MSTSVLFVCNMNSVRSPMAAAMLRQRGGAAVEVDSAGVYEGWLDPFAVAVMQEIGVSLEEHEPKAMKTIDLEEVDHIIALTEEAAAEARRFLPAERITLWRVRNPSNERGGRDEVLTAYRGVRDELSQRIDALIAELS